MAINKKFLSLFTKATEKAAIGASKFIGKKDKIAADKGAVDPMRRELNKIKDELNRWLVPAYGEKLYIDFDYTSISEMQEEMDKVVNQMSSAWWLTPNEKRQAMSYGVEPDNEKLNDYYIPMNLVPLQDEAIEEDFKSVKVDYNELLDSKRQVRRDVYTTASEARERAEQIGCSGIHSHDSDGQTIYMPCSSHESYEGTKKSYIAKMVDELKVSLEEAEAMYERGDDLHSPEEKAKDDTNFPSPGINQAVRNSNSKQQGKVIS